MKKRTTISFVLFVLFYFATNFTQAQTVYVTDGGKKFHMKNCSVVSTGKKGLEQAEAKKKGYTPCSVCKPNEKGVSTESKKKTK
jgi:hypothetical protein